MKFTFEEIITYVVDAFDLDEAEMKMGDENGSDYEVNRELNYAGEGANQ